MDVNIYWISVGEKENIDAIFYWNTDVKDEQGTYRLGYRKIFALVVWNEFRLRNFDISISGIWLKSWKRFWKFVNFQFL